MIDHGVQNGADNTPRIAIIGGGFSGSAVAYHLARIARLPVELTIYEPRGAPGRGVAYWPRGEHLLLNVPTGRLSIDPDLPGDFLRWCESRGLMVAPDSFVPREWFGDYTETRLTQAIEQSGGRVRLRISSERVTRIDDGPGSLHLFAGNGLLQRAVHGVLALGHGPTRVPEVLAPHTASDRVLLNPWDAHEMEHVASSSERVLLVGTGLTMCDAAISLARLGFSGEITAVSRHGLLPQPHGPSEPASLSNWRDTLPVGSLRGLRRAFLEARRSHDWRSCVDAIRPRTSELWGALSPRDKARFVGRLAPYWEVHRHRMPPALWNAVRMLMDYGMLRIVRGHLQRVTARRPWLSCVIGGRSRLDTETLHADAIVLCTGPDPDPLRWNSPLVGALLDEGIATRDAMGMGLRATEDGFLVGRGAIVHHRLSTIGPTRRGSLWESTAVPELSTQAERLAAGLLERFVQGRDATGSVDPRWVGKEARAGQRRDR